MNRFFSFILAAVLLLGASPLLRAQGPDVSIMPIRVVTVSPGGASRFTVTFHISQGFHINSNKPYSDLLIPTEIKLTPPTELMITNVRYPAGEDISLAAMPEEKLNVYSGTVTLSGQLRAARNASRGTFRVHGQLKYQACSDRQCFPPKTAPLAIDVKVVRRPRPR
jgi:DsbC/DsbD-like thiol-disulfide interchange protein